MKRFFKSKSKLIRVLLPVFLVISSFGFLYATNVLNVKAQTNSILKSIFLSGNESGEVVCDGKMSFTIDPSEPGKLLVTCDGETIGGVETSPTPTPEVEGEHDSSGGLTGTYFHNKDFTDFALQRLDPTINFAWDQGSADSAIDPNTFSVIWNGFIHTPHAGEYTFYTSSDDGVRLWVNDQEVVANWSDHPETQNTGKVTLEADKWYPITFQFYENYGGAVAKLSWSHAQIQKQIVPSEHLAPEDGVPSEEAEHTHAPSPTPTPSASTVPAGTHSTGGLGTGNNEGPEVGINLAKFNELKTKAASGEFDRECTSAEHDPEVWHTLVNEQAKCHYNHHHGDDPNYTNDVFGEPGAWFNEPGQSISYPWQTFKTNANAPRTITAVEAGALNGGMENQVKHEGYNWIVRRNQPCETSDGRYCVKDFRLQFHAMMHGAGDVASRFHSFSAEMNLCVDMNDPSTCGIYRTGGWMDHGSLRTTDPTNDEFGRVMCGPNGIQYIPLAVDNQFFGLPLTEGSADPLRSDVFRCHPLLTDQMIASGPENRIRTDQPMAEWWTHGSSDFRFQLRVNDPIGDIRETSPGSGTLATHFYCAENDPNCKWNQSLMTARLQYVVPLNSYFSSGFVNNGVIQMPAGERYLTRFGGINDSCTAPGLDCVPLVLDDVAVNPGGLGYSHRNNFEQCTGCSLVDHDITPTGKSSWITWFYNHH